MTPEMDDGMAVSGPVEAAEDKPGRIGRRDIYSGRIVKLSLDEVRFPGGDTGELEHIRHPGASAVLPFLDPPTDPDPRVLLIRQYRYSAGGYLWEVPAGMPEAPDEPWERCARRELAEETGYRAGRLRYLTRIYTTPGFTDEVIHLFAAGDLEPGGVDKDEDEFMEVVVHPFSRVLEMIRAGELVDAKSVSALLYVGSFLERAWKQERLPPAR